MTPTERLRRALAEIPALDARIRRTKSFMGGGTPPREQLADLLDDVQNAMALIVPSLSPTRLLACVAAAGRGTVALALLCAAPTASQHTPYASFIGDVWSFHPAGERTLTASAELCAAAAAHAGSGLPVVAVIDGEALTHLA